MITTVKDSVTRWKFRQRLRANDSRLSSGLAQEQSVQALQLGTPDASDHIQKAVCQHCRGTGAKRFRDRILYLTAFKDLGWMERSAYAL